MTWSTSALARLAGTTTNTIRHYHAMALLPEPERAGNCCKRYGPEHLVKLLEILRLRDLGVPLTEIAGGFSAADRGLATVYSHEYDEEAVADVRSIMSEAGPHDAEFDALDDSADEETRSRLAELIAPVMLEQVRRHP